MKRKNYFQMTVLVAVFLLSGCLVFQSPQEKIHGLMENVVTKEKVFEDQQDPLVRLETNEQELYKQIIESNDEKVVIKLSKEAITSISERRKLIDKEQSSLEASKQEFQKMEEYLPKIENESVRTKAEKLFETMMDRYAAHDELYENYVSGLNYDKDLYTLFQKKDRSMKELEEQIKNINQAYEKVISANEKFNELTTEYNQLKSEFYSETGFDKKNS